MKQIQKNIVNQLRSVQVVILSLLVASSAFLFAPFIQEESFEYPKALFLIIATGGLSVINLIQWIYGKSHFSFRDFYKNLPIELKILGFTVVTELLAFAFSTDRSLSLVGAQYRFQGLIARLTLIIFFINIVWLFKNLNLKVEIKLFRLFAGFCFVSAIIALLPLITAIPFLELESFNNRVYGTFGNPNYLAVFIVALIPFSILDLNSASKLAKLFSWVGLGFSIIALFLSGSRSAWVALLFAMLIIGIIDFIKKRNFKILAITLLILFFSSGIFTFQKFNETKIFHRLSLTEDNVGSVTTRFYLMDAGLKLFLERPLLGTGQEAIAGKIEKYLPEYLKQNEVFYIDRTHNEFLDVLVMQGIVGFMAYMVFWIVLLWQAIKHYIKTKSKNIFADRIFLFSICGVISILAYYSMNFTTVSANILLYLFAGYLVAKRT